MTKVYIGARVRTKRRKSLGTVVGHHPTLPAWQVRFSEDRKALLFWYDALLEVIA